MNTTHDISIARAAWRAERLDELHSDTTALLDALNDDARNTLLGDLIDALRQTYPDASMTGADRMILRVSAAEDVLERVIDWVIRDEDERGKWSSYVFEPEYDAEKAA